jgi:hypothetical protein
MSQQRYPLACPGSFPSHPLHHPKPPRRQRQAIPADAGVLPWHFHGPASPHPPFHHRHMQRRRGQIHGGQAHIPRRHAYLGFALDSSQI